MRRRVVAEEVRGKDSTSPSKELREGVHDEGKNGEDDEDNDTQQPRIRGCMLRRNVLACESP